MRHGYLLRMLTWRQIGLQFRGTLLGAVWMFLGPLILLAIFSFVFMVLIDAGDSATRGGKASFAVILFCGLLSHTFVTGILVEAPTVVLQNPNFNAGISIGMLLILHLLTGGSLEPTLLLLPLVWLPAVIYMVGIGWMLAGVGTIARDVSNLITAIIPILIFVSPVFYTAERLPPEYRGFLLYGNPIAALIENNRAVLIWGEIPDISVWLFHSVVSIIMLVLGFAFFKRLRPNFASVM